MSSLSDILTATKNLVSSVNNLGQTYNNVQGTVSSYDIGGARLVKNGGGRLVNVVVLEAGSSVGTIYDSTSLTGTINSLCKIPNTVGVNVVNMPFGLGMVVCPGEGQVVTVSYS